MRVSSLWLVCVAALGLVSPAPADIISYWDFDGDSMDSVGPNNGTPQGSFSYVSGKFGQAISLASGTNNWVDIPNHASLDVGSAMTATMWVNVSSNATNLGLLTRDETTYKYMIYVSSTGHLHAYRRSSGTAVATTGISDTWRNSNDMALVTMTYDADGGTDNLKIYLNGELGGTATLTGNIDNGTLGLDIGRWSGTTSTGTRIIDDVALFNHAWTPAEVLAAYNLANHVDLTYNTLDAYQLFAEHRNPGDGAQVDDLVWNYVDGLGAGTPGSLIQDGNGDFLLYLSATDGLTTAAQVVPEPGTLALFGVALVGFALVTRARRTVRF